MFRVANDLRENNMQYTRQMGSCDMIPIDVSEVETLLTMKTEPGEPGHSMSFSAIWLHYKNLCDMLTFHAKIWVHLSPPEILMPFGYVPK